MKRIRESVLSLEHEPLLPDLDRDLCRQYGISARNPSEDKVVKLWERCRDDPELYIFGGFVRTFDEKDNRRKPFPDIPYLRKILTYIHETPRGGVVAFPKSRHMRLTWIVSSYCSYRAKFFDQTRVMWQSKKDQYACDIVYRNSWLHARIAFIERALPPFMWSIGLKGTKGDLWYPQGSVVSAIPQGPDMFRSYACTVAVSDECCFQDQFEAAYGAMTPMIKGDSEDPLSGGIGILVSSARAGAFFGELIEAVEIDRIMMAA